MLNRSLQLIRALGLRFWLSLPLLSLFVWTISGWATDWILDRSSASDKAFVIEAPSDSPAIVIQAIHVTIQPQQFAIVTVFALNQPLRKLEFRFPYTEPERLEPAIAQVLGLSQTQVRQVIRYQN